MFAIENGSASSMSASAAPSDVGESASREKSGAASANAYTMPARITPGVPPMNAMNSTAAGTPMSARRRLPRSAKSRNPSRIDTCIPETETT